jgi:hypothetical protein
MAKSYQPVAEYPSASNPGRVYTVSVDEEGNLSCTCPAWVFKKGDVRTCKHVEDYQRNGVPVVAAPALALQAEAREKGGFLADLFAKLDGEKKE